MTDFTAKIICQTVDCNLSDTVADLGTFCVILRGKFLSGKRNAVALKGSLHFFHSCVIQLLKASWQVFLDSCTLLG